jgi:hypothetical protein
MFSLMKMFGKTKKSSVRKSRRSKSRSKVVRKTRRNRTSKKVKKGGLIPFI